MTARRPRFPGPDLRGARSQAYTLAVAPFLFQAARAARDLGVLECLRSAGASGLSAPEVAAHTGLPQTSIDTLLDGILCGELVAEGEDGRWCLTTIGLVWASDSGVRVESEFTHTVCWQGLPAMTRSLADGQPHGLSTLGPWATIYEGLTQLSPEVREAWFAYDHGHSDAAFSQALATIAEHAPQQLLDVGANTGRFALRALAALPTVHMTLLDLAPQLAEAKGAIDAAGHGSRVDFQACNLLDHSIPFPEAQDGVWMSQFLDCFAPADIVALLTRARACLRPGGSVWVLECCPDRQHEPAAAMCLRLESLYFTTMANGVSRFYRAPVLIDCADQAGLRLEASWDGLGTAHSLFRFTARF